LFKTAARRHWQTISHKKSQENVRFSLAWKANC